MRRWCQSVTFGARARAVPASGATIEAMTDPSTDARVYSPGLEGVLAGETAIARVAELLWTGEWDEEAHLPCAPLPDAVLTALRALPAETNAMDAVRTGISVWGACARPSWPSGSPPCWAG